MPVAGSKPPMGVDLSIRRLFLTTSGVAVFLWVVYKIPYGSMVALGILCLLALVSVERSLQSLSLVTVIKFLNPGLYTAMGLEGLLIWVVLAIAGARIYFQAAFSGGGFHPVLPSLLIFGAIVLVQSLLVSPFPLISAFKIISFVYVVGAILIGFSLTAGRNMKWASWFVGVWLAVILLSVPTYFRPNIGFLLNGHGFQGILAHPQNFGVFVAPMAAWSAGQLMSGQRPRWLMAGLLAAAVVVVFLSKARTGALAIVLGSCAVALLLLTRRSGIRLLAMRLSQVLAAGIAIGFVAVAIFGSTVLLNGAEQFVFKHDRKGSLAANDTRTAGIVGQWRSFLDHPALGIGFGVSLDPTFAPTLDRATGLPIGAPVEKGFLPTAVLEETGVVGALALVFLLGPLIRCAGFSKSLPLSFLFFTALFVNCAEMIFFSVGGWGLYMWLLFGWAATSQAWPDRVKPRAIRAGAPEQQWRRA